MLFEDCHLIVDLQPLANGGGSFNSLCCQKVLPEYVNGRPKIYFQSWEKGILHILSSGNDLQIGLGIFKCSVIYDLATTSRLADAG